MTIGKLLLTALLALGLTARAEQEGDYHREDQNIPLAQRTPDQLDDLLFWLRSDTGLTVTADGVVQAWTAAAGSGLVFTMTPGSETPPQLLPGAIGKHPAVRFSQARNRAGGLISAPVTIDPEKGLTLVVLGRVTEPAYLGYLLGYGATYQTSGSLAIWARGDTANGRAILHANTGAESPALASAAGNVNGRGFVVVAVRYNPTTGEQTLSENGFVVGRTQRTEPLAAAFPFAVGIEARGSWSLAGDILTALAYNRALSDEELAAIQRSLTTTYGLGGSGIVSDLAPKLPYAYYPSRSQMEVAIALSPELLAKAGDTPPSQVTVHVLNAVTGERVATGTVPLDAQARGQAIFAVPDFPDGEYAVEYRIGAHTERSPKTFQRVHFPFEETAFGETHEVYPPFLPVTVEGNAVSVVGRRYTVNEQGLFDSVISLDRELLAAPMRLVGETADGQPLTWNVGVFDNGVGGRAVHPDEAVFITESSAADLWLNGHLVIQEDGCAKVELTLDPRKAPVTVQRFWLEIPLKDAEAPLFHFIADNGMRFNYAGKTPRGGRIAWYREPWDHWVPLRWRVAESGPDDGVLWTSADTRQHNNQNAWDHRPFVPYLWLGAEERGLAFFMENEAGFATDYRTPLQQIVREGDRLTIRVEIFQQPVTLNEARTFTFGLMASPGKPLEPGFRTRTFASGVGPVSCWGGWQCSSKYPDNRDWRIVDKIQEIRRRGAYTKEDQAWFEERYAEVKARWPERQINGSTDWLWLTTHFARRASDRGHEHSGIYFEEHATDPRLPEWQVFQDEWASAEFNRFRDRPANWGVFSPSYHDFVLYMANEWMSRGVSLYFDNTNPKRCYNERFGPAFRTPAGSLIYGISIFGQREYYRRIYKLRSQWNQRGAEYPIDFTLHITNTQTIPFNTWATATLDLEQRAHTENPEAVPAEVEIEGKTGGFQLPWAPDYTRTITFGRQSGVIPLALDFVSGQGRHDSGSYTPQMMLRNWAMSRIHDVRPSTMYPKSAALARQYEQALLDFGYGQEATVAHHTYWEEKPFLKIADERVKWLVLVRGGEALLLLQSYSRTDIIDLPLAFPGAEAMRDVETGEIIRFADRRATVALPAPFGTRMFIIAREYAAPQPPAGGFK